MTDEATRGRPYYEKLRKDLREVIKKKQELDNSLAAIENDIAQTEAEYLESTSTAGNIIKGFDNYIKASSSTATSNAGPGTATRRKGGISDHDRIFSRSSVSWTFPDNEPLGVSSGNAARAKANADANSLHAGQSGSGASSARDTPSGAAGNANKNVGKNKKKGPSQEKSAEQDADEERPAKRNKISWGRD